MALLALFGANADFVIFSLLPAGGDHLGGVLEAGFVYGWASGSGFIKASKPEAGNCAFLFIPEFTVRVGRHDRIHWCRIIAAL